MSTFKLIGLAFLGSIFLYLAWPPLHFNYIIFISLIPLLKIEDEVSSNSLKPSSKFLAYSIIIFLLWNILTTWWIWYASGGGCILAIICNSLLMSLPVFFYHKVKRSSLLPSAYKRLISYFSLVSFWTFFEYFHLNWDGNWPWLNLGNCWAGMPDWVQWYQYTGTPGGTIWIWTVNIAIYEIIRNYARHRSKITIYRSALACLLIGLPISLSYTIKSNLHFQNSHLNAVCVQPNIDPYNEKFSGDVNAQVNKLIRLSEEAIDSNTCLLVWPETAIPQDMNEKTLSIYSSIAKVHSLLKKHPRLKLITGINSFTEYYNESEKPFTARPMHDKKGWFDIFNTAMLMDTGINFQFYHKSRLVPGVEIIPFQKYLGFLNNIAINMGGASGSLGSQKAPSIFKLNDSMAAAPVICYESIFGEYVSEYMAKGANIITIITNDGWWYNTDGYKQHIAYARLRAIENRKFIMRSANTGISCFILPSGEIVQPTQWWQEASIKHNIILDNEATFYTLHGDYLGKICGWLSACLLLLYFLSGFRKTK